MSEILLGVLNMPPECWSSDAIDVAQRYKIYREAAREIVRLQAIVDRLPKDGDGEPMTGNDEVWILRLRDGEIYLGTTHGPYPPTGYSFHPEWTDLHKTRELAEAARAKA